MRPGESTVDMPTLEVFNADTKMRIVLPDGFLGDERRAMFWVKDVCGKGSRITVEPGRGAGLYLRLSRDQFWRVLDAMVSRFHRVRVSVSWSHALPMALREVGWAIEADTVDSRGVMTRTWLVTRETIRRTPLRSVYLWRNSA